MTESFLTDVKKIPREIWESQGITDDGNRIRIPVYSEDGRALFVSERHIDKDNVFLQPAGCELYPWGLNQLKGNDTVFIVEGYTDRLTMLTIGYENVVSTPGANSWKPEWANYFKHFRNQYVIGDNDDAGYKMGLKIKSDLSNSKAVCLPLEAKDINDLWVKYQDKEKVRRLIEEAISLVEGKLPTPLKDSFIDRYIDYCTDFTDAPKEFHYFVAFSIISTVIGNKIYFELGDQRLYPNLWIVLLAPSSLFRKSYSISIGERILVDVLPDCIYPNEFSHEKLLSVLQNKPAGLFVHKEFSTIMGLLSKDYMAGAKSSLAELYDSPPRYSRKTQVDNIDIKNPCINMLSATNLAWFLDAIKDSDFKGGFLARMLFVPEKEKERSIAFPPPADRGKRQELIELLIEISKVQGQAVFSDEAKYIYKKWYREQEREIEQIDSVIIANFIRLQSYVLKLAVLIEISNFRNLKISVESMQVAINIIIWLSERLKELSTNEITFTPFDKNKKKVLELIKKNPSGIQRKDLTKYSHLKKRELDEVIETLAEEESIREFRTDNKRFYHMVN